MSENQRLKPKFGLLGSQKPTPSESENLGSSEQDDRFIPKPGLLSDNHGSLRMDLENLDQYLEGFGEN